MITVLDKRFCPRCPLCGKAVDIFALVESDAPGKPSHEFWGEEGNRKLVHVSQVAGAWCHFRNGDVHKLAYLTKKATRRRLDSRHVVR